MSRSHILTRPILLLLLLLPCGVLVAGCQTETTSESPSEPPEAVPEDSEPAPAPEWAIALHGGAGVIERDDTDADAYYRSLAGALDLGRTMLAEGAAALETVEAVVRQLEDDPLFNAGRGAVFTNRGTHELDAAIMDGRTLSCGAVTGLINVRNPVTLARLVMERSKHVLLAGDGADRFAREVGVERVPQDYFTTERRLRQLQEAVRAEREGRATGGFGTVGAVALDRYGNLAAATSTGGLTNKRFGRIGDVPIIGAGTYANNETAAISCTGVGEQFIRHTVAHEVSALVAYRGDSLEEAAREVVHERLNEGDGGLVAVGADGSITLTFNSAGMFRGAADERGRFEVGIWEELRPAGDWLTDDGGSP
jgi:beta-aspartyl-peptidase (threonine type)